MWKTVLMIVLSTSLLKLLFLPCYRSTDFEVHRNWLAVTHSLPLDRWYVDATSEWTLDYPPFFAYFEFVLSQAASWVDPKMLSVSNLNYASEATVVFQRVSVIFADLLLALGCIKCFKDDAKLPSALAVTLLNGGLLLVDHIHFQYNGFLFGFSLLSIGAAINGGYLESGFWFAVLLNFKHIYLYSAPVYFVFLLRHYCMSQVNNSFAEFIKRLTKLGIVVLSVFACSLAPFAVKGQLSALLARLFPFKRGLCHAYWAPNFWALYNVADKILAKVLNKGSASMTRGLVEEFDHAVLPSIVPLTTFVLAFISMIPALINLWTSKGTPEKFLKVMILCSFGSFLFGWHVHEKAILLVTIPWTILAFINKDESKDLFLVSTVGHVSLLPLIFTPEERLLRIAIVITYSVALQLIFRVELTSIESVYLTGLCAVVAFETAGFPSLSKDVQTKFAFLPLLLYSVYCSLGLLYCWIRLYARTVSRKVKTM